MYWHLVNVLTNLHILFPELTGWHPGSILITPGTDKEGLNNG